MLFMILAGLRVNTLVHLKVTNMYITATEVTFTFDKVLKHSRPSYKQKSLIFRTINLRDFCPMTKFITHLEHRLLISDDPTLFITPVKPLPGLEIQRSKKHYLREIHQEYPQIDENFGLKLLEQWDSRP